MKRVFNQVISSIREKDIIVDPVIINFHFEMNLKQKTVLGGIASLIVKIYIFYVAIIKGIQMVNRD